MRTIIILLLTTLLCTNNIVAQTSTNINIELLSLEKQYFAATNLQQKTNIAFAKMQLFIKNNLANNPECEQEINRIDPELLSKPNQDIFYWNATMVSILGSKSNKAHDFILKYQSQNKDTSTNCQLLQLMTSFNTDDSIVADKNWQPIITNIYNCHQQEINFAEQRKEKYNWTSYIIPGAGMAIKGYYIKASSAFLINSASAFLIVELIKNGLYINAFGYGMITIAKFYSGNLLLTKKLIPVKKHATQTKDMSDCKKKLDTLLQEYPIEFKF